MGKGGGGKMKVVDYYMSGHWRIAHPVDELIALYFGEKEAWTGSATTSTDIQIRRSDLFGGNKKEGGVSGTVRFLPGGPDQVMPEHLAARLGLTSATCPGYRAMSSIFFTGSGGAGATTGGTIARLLGFAAKEFRWASNNPYLKPIWAKVRRRPRGLNQSLAVIDTGDGRKNVNPIHIIYECLISTEWGQGGAPSGINTASFEAAAQTLYNEKFGMSLLWTRQTDIESFVSEILDHVHATMFVNPGDGLMTIKLIRGDYDIDDLPILNVDNCRITNFDRKAWGETVNEVVVTWTNPENEQEETVAAQNNANIAIQGGIISDSRNYYGVRNVDLAQELAFRDLKMASWPLALFEVECDRTAWNLVPGGCVRLQYPEYGIDDVVLRISKIDYGKPGAPSIKLSTIEDIFALASADYDPSNDTEWIDPSVDPSAAAYARIITAPAFFASRALTAAEAGALDYPEVLPALLVSDVNDDTYAFNLYGQETQPNGDVIANLIGTRATLGHALLEEPLAAEAETLLPTFGEALGGTGPRPGGFAIIGNVNEQGQEIVLLDSFDEDGWVLKRGVLDTVPRAWPDGTTVWFVSIEDNIVLTGTPFSDAETVVFKVAPSTSRGTLSLEDAPIIGAELTGRPHLPLRPANVIVGGVAFGSVDLSTGGAVSSVAVSWANRNRLTEDTQVMAWNDGNVTPEVGQTTTIKVFSTNGDLLGSATGLTGTSHALPVSAFNGRNVGDVRLYAVRDGLESLQGHTVRVKIRPFGWGDNWGEDWGGSDSGSIGNPENPVPPDYQIPPDFVFPPFPPWVIIP